MLLPEPRGRLDRRREFSFQRFHQTSTLLRQLILQSQCHRRRKDHFLARQSVFWVSVICGLILYVCGVTLTRITQNDSLASPAPATQKTFIAPALLVESDTKGGSRRSRPCREDFGLGLAAVDQALEIDTTL
eukprot:s1694_g11.t1